MTARRPPAQASLPIPPEPGVHLGMPHARYHEVPAIGSSDIDLLARDSHSWWFDSVFNPDRRQPKRRSPALLLGDALHALMLEGDEAYAARFVVEPDSARSHWVRTRDARRKLLREKGIEIPHGEFDPAKLNMLCRKAGIGHLVWDVAYADFERAKDAGQDVITTDQDRRLRHMAWLVGQHPDLGANLRSGLSEVSVFWRREDRPDVLLRARFDKLLPGACIDLKTFSNPRDRSPEEATFDAIAEHGYDLQAELYREAREKLAQFVREGRIFLWRTTREPHSGATMSEPARALASDREALAQIVAVEPWRWIWIFYQIRSDEAGSARAPVLVPWWTWPRGPLFDDARGVIDRALDNYEARIAEFGLHKAWAEIRPITALPVDRLKRLAWKRNPT